MSCDKCKIIKACDIKTDICPCRTCLLKSICSQFCEQFDNYCKKTYTQKYLDDGHEPSSALNSHVHSKTMRLLLHRTVDDLLKEFGINPGHVK